MQNHSDKKIPFFRRYLRVWIMLIIGISLFIFLIRQIPFNELTAILLKVKVRYLFAALLTGLTTTMLRTMRYAGFFPVSRRWLELYGVFAFMRLLNFTLPFRTGEVVFLKILKKYRFSPSIAETAPVWLLLRVTDVIAITVLLTLALSMASFRTSFVSARWVLVGVSVGLVVIILYLPFWASRTRYNSSDSWLAHRLRAFQEGVKRIQSIPVLLRTIGMGVLIWAMMVTFNSFAQLAFDTPLNIYQCALVSVLVLAISMLPIRMPLSIGTGEAAWAGGMMVLGVDVPLAVGLAIGIRLISIFIIIVDGLIGLSLLWVIKRH